MKFFLKFSVLCVSILILTVSVYARISEITYENAVVKEKTNEYTVYIKPDGTIITKYSDREKAVFPDGTTIDFNKKTGIKEAVYKDGVKLIVDYPKGIRTLISADGSKQIFDYNGKTMYGDQISEIRKNIQKDPVVVSLFFNPLMSDDFPDAIVLKTYNMIFDALYRSTVEKKYESKKPLTVEIGYCHFGSYGKCYNISNRLFLTFISGEKTIKKFEINSLLLNDENKMQKFIDQVIKYFSTL